MTVLTRQAPAVLQRLSNVLLCVRRCIVFDLSKGPTRPRTPFVKLIAAISFVLTSFQNAAVHCDTHCAIRINIVTDST